MPKKIKNCFYKKLTFDNLLAAHYRARKNKGYRNEVIRYQINLENNLMNLCTKIKNRQYRHGKYREFIVYEPKKRTIKSLPYEDRIVHQWYVEEFIKPNILPQFIYTTYACIDGRGTHKAVEQVQKYMRIMKRNHGNYWILKCDIKGFFYNINQDILFNILARKISDKELLYFTRLLIFDDSLDHKGIPIGNFTSQYFANIYMNELDQYCKRILKLKYYVRYMDDFIILLNTKKECVAAKKNIQDFLGINLDVELNAKSRYYPNSMGVDFCGYRIFETHRLLRKSSKKKIKKKVAIWNMLYNKNRLDILQAVQALKSWLAHSSHCDSYNLQQKMIKNCKFIYQ